MAPHLLTETESLMQGKYCTGDDELPYDIGDDARKRQAEDDAWEDGLVEWPDLGEGPCW